MKFHIEEGGSEHTAKANETSCSILFIHLQYLNVVHTGYSRWGLLLLAPFPAGNLCEL